uniref:Protein xpaR7 n=1 Tax=Bacillus licheniformis TaxID=1402 RepID=XPR7_BACLI|nr:RecName: Full=Protein xpaR7 [Bacillus licheniformis]AAA22885.1 XpaR7 [Bacillus licheniformis]
MDLLYLSSFRSRHYHQHSLAAYDTAEYWTCPIEMLHLQTEKRGTADIFRQYECRYIKTNFPFCYCTFNKYRTCGIFCITNFSAVRIINPFV